MSIHLLLVFTLLFNVAPLNDPKPDFTGTWNARMLRPTDGSAAAFRGLKISYSDPKLKISRILMSARSMGSRSGQEFVYYTNGKRKTQKSRMTSDSIESKAERIGERFVITESYTTKLSGGKTITERLTTLEVSSDGTTLTETSTRTSEGNSRRIVYRYDRLGDSNSRDINGDWVERLTDKIVSLTIEHHDPEIKVTRRVLAEAQDDAETYIYYTDGRGETNVKDGRSMKSVTRWKDGRLIFEFWSSSTLAGDKIEFQQSINWQIAKDGGSIQEITQQRTWSNKGAVIPGSSERTLVYARSSKPLP